MAKQKFYGYEINFPDQWEDASIIAIRAPEGDGNFRRNVVITQKPASGMDLKAAVGDARKELVKQKFPDLKLLKETPRMLDNTQAIELEFEHSMPTPGENDQVVMVRFARRHVVIKKQEMIISITYTDTAEQATLHALEFDEFLTSMKLPQF